ncbi:MAG: hypothetical protein LBR30_03455 [Clostridioides sp.]|jgi:hypothetical protein|nr:hypothetical protein [Clostridioides sp.]
MDKNNIQTIIIFIVIITILAFNDSSVKDGTMMTSTQAIKKVDTLLKYKFSDESELGGKYTFDMYNKLIEYETNNIFIIYLYQNNKGIRINSASQLENIFKNLTDDEKEELKLVVYDKGYKQVDGKMVGQVKTNYEFIKPFSYKVNHKKYPDLLNQDEVIYDMDYIQKYLIKATKSHIIDKNSIEYVGLNGEKEGTVTSKNTSISHIKGIRFKTGDGKTHQINVGDYVPDFRVGIDSYGKEIKLSKSKSTDDIKFEEVSENVKKSLVGFKNLTEEKDSSKDLTATIYDIYNISDKIYEWE